VLISIFSKAEVVDQDIGDILRRFPDEWWAGSACD
jgi:hypothetical protein